MMPVLIGEDYRHVMARATIEQTAAEYGQDDSGNRILKKDAEVVITIVSKGGHAQELGDFVAATEIVALSFSGVPVRPAP
jgi:hypothetical protein